MGKPLYPKPLAFVATSDAHFITIHTHTPIPPPHCGVFVTGMYAWRLTDISLSLPDVRV